MTAAKRELLEETGLIADGLELINITNDPRDDRHYVHIIFLAKSVQGEPIVIEPDKCEKWEWYKMSNLPKPLFFGHKKLLEAIMKNELLAD